MQQVRSRVHFLVAREAPVVVVIQRKRSKLFHVLMIDAGTLAVEEGSWFHGKLYPEKCDVSFDGQHMVYLAMGGRGQMWNAVCRLPWLKALVECEHLGTYDGGGLFEDRKTLRTISWLCEMKVHEALPFLLKASDRINSAEVDLLERDGFRRLQPDYRIKHRGMDADDGWVRGPKGEHPSLTVRYAGHHGDESPFTFELEGHPGLLADATWANWDSLEQLWVARPGTIERWTLRDLEAGHPSFLLDLEKFEAPPREP